MERYPMKMSPQKDSTNIFSRKHFRRNSFRSLKRLIDTGADLLFPRHCPVCKDVLPFPYDLSSLPSLICEDCLSELSFIGRKCCQKCGRAQPISEKLTASSVVSSSPSAHEDEPELCSSCRQQIRLFERNYSLLSYGQAEREIMSDIKYRGRIKYMDLFSLLISMHFASEISSIAPDVIVPVPIHKNRLKKRGFNQAKLLGDGISRHTGIECSDMLLFRSIDTKAQKGLGYEGRILNLQNAFSADLSACRSIGTVLMVDDIYTTGSTLEACTEALLKAGVKKVYGICICAGSDVSDARNSS